MKPKNPFLIKGYAGKEFFCDRVEETGRLISAIENDRDVTLIAPRRYGKTGLISNTFSQLPKEYKSVYVDIYSTRCLADFVKLFASSVVGALDTTLEKTLANAVKFFKNCRPTVTPQQFGLPTFSFDVVSGTAEASLKEVFDYIVKRDKRLVIAIDEFQQIREYPEKGTEALIRSYIQFVPWVRFVFSGSRKHMMQDMFMSPRQPFYLSTEIMSLGVIDENRYREFAASFFNGRNLPFDAESFHYLYRRFNGITWFLQMVLNRLWEVGEGLESTQDVEAAIAYIVDTRSQEYHDLYESQTEAQRALLRAVARDGVVAEPQSADFIARHSLPASSTVGSVLKNLVERDLLYRSENGYVVYERFFREWLVRN